MKRSANAEPRLRSRAIFKRGEKVKLEYLYTDALRGCTARSESMAGTVPRRLNKRLMDSQTGPPSVLADRGSVYRQCGLAPCSC
jgi:hypothetical protein